MEHVLPRVRSRRRRPFGPNEWLALALVVMGAAEIAVCLFLMLGRDLGIARWMAIEALAMAEGAVFIALGWPTLAMWLEGD